MSCMTKIAVFGDTESIKGFLSLGLDIFPCDHDDMAHTQFKNLCNADYGVIFITEHLAALLSNEIAKVDELLTPAVVPIPGAAETNGVGVARLKAAVEKAVGSDIIFNS